MAEEGMKDFTINFIIGGFLMTCLLIFSITFMYNNNPDGLNDGTGKVLNNSYNSFSSKLIKSPEDSNKLLNITANTNPEVSDLGSRDSVAVSFDAYGSSKSFFESSKSLLSWVFSGTSGKLILGTIGGIIVLLGVFYIWSLIRTGR